MRLLLSFRNLERAGRDMYRTRREYERRPGASAVTAVVHFRELLGLHHQLGLFVGRLYMVEWFLL